MRMHFVPLDLPYALLLTRASHAFRQFQSDCAVMRVIGQAPVSLGDAITGIDDSNVGLLVKAVLHASGRRQFPASSL
jgi:hypothetical protein